MLNVDVDVLVGFLILLLFSFFRCCNVHVDVDVLVVLAFFLLLLAIL